MALANYMGPTGGLLGVGQLKGMDITQLGLEPAATTKKTKSKSPGSSGSDSDYKGYAGDAQYQANMDAAFNSEYKKLSKKYGNDALWTHSTPEYKELVQRFQGNTVGNARAAINNEKEGIAYEKLLTSKDGSHGASDLTMVWDERIQDWRPYMDNRDGFQTKQQRLENVRNKANIDDQGRITAAYLDKQGGSMEMFNNEITALLDKANKHIQSGHSFNQQQGSYGDASSGMDVAYKNSIERRWKNSNNYQQLAQAADYMRNNLSTEAQYALAQQDYKNMLKGFAYLPSGMWDPKTRQFNPDTGNLQIDKKTGKVKFDKVAVDPALFDNEEFVRTVRAFSPTRHLQEAKPIFYESETFNETIKKDDIDYGDAYGADGKVDMPIGLGTESQAGVFPETAIRTDEVYENKGMMKNIRHQTQLGERTKANAPHEFPQYSDYFRGQSIGDLLGPNSKIRVGNYWNDINELDGDKQGLLNDVRVAEVLGVGEYADPDGENGVTQGIRLRVVADDDYLDEYGLMAVNREGLRTNIGKSSYGYNYVDDDIAKIINWKHYGDIEDLGLTDKDGNYIGDEAMQALNPNAGAGDAADVFEIIIPYDQAELDKIWFGTSSREKLQTGLTHLAAKDIRNRRAQQQAQGNASIEVLNKINANTGAGNYTVDVK